MLADDGLDLGYGFKASKGAIPKSGDFGSTIRHFLEAGCDKQVEDRRSAFNFAGKIHLRATVPDESSVSENLTSYAFEKLRNLPHSERMRTTRR